MAGKSGRYWNNLLYYQHFMNVTARQKNTPVSMSTSAPWTVLKDRAKYVDSRQRFWFCKGLKLSPKLIPASLRSNLTKPNCYSQMWDPSVTTVLKLYFCLYFIYYWPLAHQVTAVHWLHSTFPPPTLYCISTCITNGLDPTWNSRLCEDGRNLLRAE